MIRNNRKGSLPLSFFVANLSANHNSQSHICVSINCWLNFNCWTFCRIRSNWPTLWKAKSQIWNIFNRSKAIKQIRHRPRPWLLLRFFLKRKCCHLEKREAVEVTRNVAGTPRISGNSAAFREAFKYYGFFQQGGDPPSLQNFYHKKLRK